MGKTRIEELRKDLGLTQEQLGKGIGVNFRTISNYEKDVREPDIETLKKLSKFFKVTIDEIVRND